MNPELQLFNANTTYASLLSAGDFSQHVETLDHRGQLDFCRSIFHANSLVEKRSHELVFRAWERIEQHQLYLHIQKTEAQYWQEVDNLYRIAPIVETEKRKPIDTLLQDTQTKFMEAAQWCTTHVLYQPWFTLMPLQRSTRPNLNSTAMVKEGRIRLPRPSIFEGSWGVEPHRSGGPPQLEAGRNSTRPGTFLDLLPYVPRTLSTVLILLLGTL